MTTDNEYVIKGINYLPPIICPDDSNVKKVVINSTRLANSNLNGFNNNVGSVTNIATSIRNKMAKFDKDSEEYKELEKREMTIQRIQQTVIDSIKGTKAEKIPSSWHNEKCNIILESDTESIKSIKEFNMKILSDKKPYFFKYIYPYVKKEYDVYLENWNNNCIRMYGKPFKELEQLVEYLNVVEKFYDNCVVDCSNSLMNQICNHFENEFDGWFTKSENKLEFDYTIMKTEKKYDVKIFNAVKKIYDSYLNHIKENAIIRNEEGYIDKEAMQEQLISHKQEFINDAQKVCNLEEDLCNIVLDMCYQKSGSKQFAWDMCGERIIYNLLQKNDMKITYFEKDDNGIINFSGETFTMKKKKVEKKIWESH